MSHGQLKNTLQFNLEPGASVVIPHRLESPWDTPQTPDIIFVPTTDIDVSADDTNVTITNNGTNAYAGAVLVEYWHTIERSFGAQANVNLSVKPYIVVGAESVVNAPLLTFVFRPGAVGVEAPGGNVFTDWATLMVAVDQTKYLGQRAILFDNRFAPDPLVDPVLAPYLAFNAIAPALDGLWPCAIPPPPPGSSWDLRDIQWVDRGLPPGGGSLMVQFWDGGPGRPCLVDNIKRIDNLILGLIYNGFTPGNYPIISSRSATVPGYSFGIQSAGGRFRMYNTNPLAQPMWLADATGENFCNFRNDAQIGNGVALPAPIIEVADDRSFLAFGLDNFQIMDNAFKGNIGTTVTVRVQSAGQGGNTRLQTYSNPSFAGAFNLGFNMNAQRWRPSPTILTANGAAFNGEVTRVNSTNNPVIVTLPPGGPIAPTTGTSPYGGSAITVLDYNGTADVNLITVRAQVCDSINGNVEAGGGESDVTIPATAYSSLRFWTDGTTPGKWFVIT